MSRILSSLRLGRRELIPVVFLGIGSVVMYVVIWVEAIGYRKKCAQDEILLRKTGNHWVVVNKWVERDNHDAHYTAVKENDTVHYYTSPNIFRALGVGDPSLRHQAL